MPIPLVPVISAGASLLGAGISAYGQGKMNKRTIKYNKQMYSQQRSDALADRDYQNQYDSPAEQMARYKAAGLNPNLIYGQNASSASVRSSDTGPAPQGDPAGAIGAGVASLGDVMSQFYNLQQVQAQTDNLRAQYELLKQQREMADLNIQGQRIANSRAATGNAYDSLKFHLAEKLAPYQLTAADLANKKTTIDSEATAASTKRANELQAGALQNQAEQILSMQATRGKTEQERRNAVEALNLMKKEGLLKTIEINLRKKGINPNDPQWQKFLGELLYDIKEGATDFFK